MRQLSLSNSSGAAIPPSLSVTASTSLSFSYTHTRVLLLCDVSASLSVIDPSSARPLYATMIDSLAVTLRHLAASPFLLPSVGCCLYVSIVAHKASSDTPFYVLCQAALLSADSVDAMVEMACSRLMEVENQQADEQQQQAEHVHSAQSESQQWESDLADEREEDGDDSLSSLISSSSSTSSTSLHQLLRHALFFLDRMPSCAAPAIVLLSDSVLALSSSLPDYDSIAALLARRSITLSVVQLTSVSSLSTFSFGYVADAEVVRHIVRSTGGWFGSCAEVTARLPDDRQLTAMDEAVFVRHSSIAPLPEKHKAPRPEDMLPALTRRKGRQTTASIAPSVSSPFAHLLSFSSLSSLSPRFSPTPAPLTRSSSLSSFSLSPASFLLRERVKRYEMTADVLRVLECRTREGFTAYAHSSSSQQLLLLRREHSPHLYIDYMLRVDSSHTAQQQPQQSATIHVYGTGSRPTVLKLSRGGSLGTDRQIPHLEAEVHVIAQRNVLDGLWLHRQREQERRSAQSQRSGARQLEMVEDDSLPASVWSYVCEMERSDTLLTQLSKVTLDAVELRFTHAKSQLMTTTIPTRSSNKHYIPPTLPAHQNMPPSPSPTSTVNGAAQPPLTITLPPLPPFVASSYLSPSHPLWHFLAGCPTSRWRRFFPLHHMSVLCSLHRTSQLELRLEMELELELEIDFQTLARVHEKSAVSSSFARAVSSVALPSSVGAADAADDNGLVEDVGDMRHPHAIRSGLGQQEVAAALCRLLQGWSSITVSNSFFVFLPSRPSLSSADIDSPLTIQSLSDVFDCFVSSSLPFVLVRLGWKTKFLASITLAFHACDPHTRATVTHSLSTIITNANITARKRREKEEDRHDGSWPTPLQGSAQHDEEQKRQDESDYAERGDDRELLLNRVNSLASRRSSIPSLSPSKSPSRRSGVVESVRPFGVIDQPVETIILRPSSIIAGGTSASLFHTLFPPPSPSSRLLSTSTAPSFSSSRRLLALLRSYMRYHSWMWELPSSVSMKSAVRLLRAARAEEGFVLVASISSSSTWLREIPIVQAAADEPKEMDEAESEAFIRQLSTNTAIHSPISPERPGLMMRSLSTPNLRYAALGAAHHVHSLPSLLSSTSPLALFPPSSHPPRTAGVPSSCFIQYSVTEIDATHIQTEVWMEPFYGVAHVPIPLPHPSDVPASPFPRSPQQASTAAFHTLTSEQLFVHLSSWVHSCDLHLLSAVSTFDSVRDLELNPDIAIQMARRAEGKAATGRSKRQQQQQQQWGLDDTYSSSGLALQLVDDLHATQGWDYDRDSRSRLLSRFTSAHGHPRLMLSIGTVSRLLGLLKAGSASALYARLKAHGGSLSDMSQLGERERSASAVSSRGPSHSSSMDELHSMSRMRRNSSAVSVAPSEDDDELKRLASPPPATHFTPPSHRGFTLTSPVAAPLTSPVNVSPLISPLPAFHAPLFSSPPRTARAMPQWTDATAEARRQEARRQRRLRHEREIVPYSLTYLLECSPSLTLQLPLPTSASPLAADSHVLSQSSPPAMARTAPISTPAATPHQSPATTITETPQRSSPPSHSHSQSTSSLPNIFVTPPSSSHTTHVAYASRSQNNTPKQQSTPTPLDGHTGSSSNSEGSALYHGTSAECMHDLLVRTVRRLADVELIEGRCFAQLVNEYTIVLALLPHPPAVSAPSGPNASTGFRASRVTRTNSEENKRKAEEEEQQRNQRDKEMHAYLDRLLALHSADMEGDSESNCFTVALYECSRDEFSHPRVFWPEGDSLPVLSSSLSLSALHVSDSHMSLQADSRASSSASPFTTPPLSPHLQAQSLQHDRSPLHSPLPSLPNSYTLCDGRGPPQLSPHKQAVLMAHVRSNALRYLFSTPPLISHHLIASSDPDVLRSLALVSGTAHVVHTPLSPAVTPNKDMQSPSPLLSPLRSPPEKKQPTGRGGQLLTSPTSNRTAFQLDETIDEEAARLYAQAEEAESKQANEPSADATERDTSAGTGGEEEEEEENGSAEQFDTPLQEQQQQHPDSSTSLATPIASRLNLDDTEEEGSAASPASAFSARLAAAHMRNYAKVAYMQMKRQPQHVDEADLQFALEQCDEYEELIDLSSIQQPTEQMAAAEGGAEKKSSTTPFSAVKVVDRLHNQLHDILAERFVQLSDHELFLWKGSEAVKESSPPHSATGLSILHVLSPTASPTPASAQLSGGGRRGSHDELLQSSGSINSADGGGSDGSGDRPVDDDAKGEMAAFPLPLFLQLKAIVRPSAIGIAALQSHATNSAMQLETLPPMQLETAVTAETDWSELAVRMIAYQQPDWWTALRPEHETSRGGVLGEGVECVLAVKGCTLSRYSDRAPHSASQTTSRVHPGTVASGVDVTPAIDSPASTTRSLTASGAKRTGALYSGMPSELRLVMQSLYHHIEQAVGECQIAIN